MTCSLSIATYDKLKMELFLSYVPLYKSIILTCSDYLIEEYLETDTIGEFIVKYKNNNNVTLKDISKLTGFSVSHLSNVINGKLASNKLIKSIKELNDLYT